MQDMREKRMAACVRRIERRRAIARRPISGVQYGNNWPLQSGSRPYGETRTINGVIYGINEQGCLYQLPRNPYP